MALTLALEVYSNPTTALAICFALATALLTVAAATDSTCTTPTTVLRHLLIL